jgi:glycosyltransferase involved in cell wall biosynthesis
MSQPLISICIPAYERVDFLKRLLDSITIQTFKDYEVIIVDDSQTDKIKDFVRGYPAPFKLVYYKNEISIGSGRNMHECRKYATGEWIKIVHDDDWFTSASSLQEFANATEHGADIKYIFSGYRSFYESTGKLANSTITQQYFQRLISDPSVIYGKNIIGPPSVLMIHKSVEMFYDINLKWFIDVEYYYRILHSHQPVVYLTRPLMSVSFNDSQITSYAKTDPFIVIPETLYILNKYKKGATSHIAAYDGWWRVFRNLDVASVAEVQKFSKENFIPIFVKNMVSFQGSIPKHLLKIGIISKFLMLMSYLSNNTEERFK